MEAKRGTRARIKRMYSTPKRLLAFLLALAMIFTNVGMEMNTAYAADYSETVTFSMSGSQLVEAIEDSIANGNEVTAEDLEFTNGKVDKFNDYFFNTSESGGVGTIYEAYPDTEGGDLGAELRVFVRLPEGADDMYMVTGDEEIIFLYVNNGDETISCTTEITRTVDGQEKVKKTKRITIKSFEAAYGDEEVNIISGSIKETEAPDETKETSESQTTVPAESGSQETAAAPEESESAPAEEESAPAEGESAPAEEESAPAEGESAPAESGSAAESAPEEEQKEDGIRETSEENSQEEISESEKAADIDKSDKAEESEKSDKTEKEEKAEPEEVSESEDMEPVAAVIRHFAPMVAEPEEKDDVNREAKAIKETESAEEKTEAADETAAADSGTAAADSETAAADSGTAAADSETAAADSETAAADSGTAAADSETAAADTETTDSETTAADIGTTAADTETTAADTDIPDESLAESTGSTEQESEVTPETPGQPETADQLPPATPSNGTSDESKDNESRPGTKDLAGVGYCSTAKIYTTTLDELKALDDIAGYRVAYEIAPEGNARIIDGSRSVKEGEALSFGVRIRADYRIMSVKANGEELEQVEQEDAEQPSGEADASETEVSETEVSEAEVSLYTYRIDEVGEDQEIYVELGPKLIPAKVYTAETDDVTVTISVPDGAFEEEVMLQVSKIEDEAKLKQLTDQAGKAMEPGKAVSGIMAYDISFLSGGGEEQEPAEPVSVNMNFKKSVMPENAEASAASQIAVIHLPDSGEAETVAETKDMNPSEIDFNLDSFSEVLITEETSAVASIDETGYKSIQAAIDHAGVGDTIKLEVDVTSPTSTTLSGENVTITGKNLTIDINGKKWSGENAGDADINAVPTGIKSVMTVVDSTLTLVGSGTIMGYDKYRIITAENSALIIGSESGDGPELKGSTDGAVTGEAVSQKGGVILASKGSITLNSGVISDGNVMASSKDETAYGGGIAVLDGEFFIMNGGSIENNRAQPLGSMSFGPAAAGGGVYLKNTPFEMNDGSISGNYARNTRTSWSGYVGEGGGIYADESSITINGGNIDNNFATGGGGGIYASKSPITITEGSIGNNSAKGSGGGIYAYKSAIILSDGSVDGNTVSGSTFVNGGGIFFNSTSSLLVEGGSISNNTSQDSSGGGVEGMGPFTMTGGKICDNKAGKDSFKKGGGGVNVTKLTMTGGTISGNTADGYGGGICVTPVPSSPEIQITNAVITGNTSEINGGGIYCNVINAKRSFSFGDVTIADNKAQRGGGVAASGSSKTLFSITENTRVYNNTATDDTVASNNITAARVSDEFLFIGDSYFEKTGFDELANNTSGIKDATEHVINVTGQEDTESVVYTLVKGGKSKGNSSSIGYYNYYDINIDQDKCVNAADVYLDPGKLSRHFVWNEESGKAELLTEENGLSVTLKDACEKAQKNNIDTIYICSPVKVTKSDEDCLNKPGITFKRCEENHTGSLFVISGGVTMNGTHIDGAQVTANMAMVQIPTGAVLKVTGQTILENANNTESAGGAVSVCGTLEMDGGLIRNNNAKSGGGVYAYYNSARAHFEGGTLTGNKATDGDGGAIYVFSKAKLEIGTDETASSRTVISNNTCTSEGGGITLNGFSSAEVYRADIINNIDHLRNSGYAAGGGIHIWKDCTMRMKNLYITNNIAAGNAQSYGALYSCPTGKLAIYELDGALVVDNGPNVPDIMFNNNNSNNPVFISNVALGGGDITYYKGNGDKADPSEYQYVTTNQLSLYSRAADETKSDAGSIAGQAGVYMTGNLAYDAGSAIANNGTLIVGTETEALQVVKEWEDAAGNPLAEHPEEVLVYLTKTIGGKTTMVKTDGRIDGCVSLNADNGWSYTWENLSSVTDPGDGGKIITWGVVEAGMSGFTGKATEPEKIPGIGAIADKAYRVTLTNTPSEARDTGSLTVEKAVYADNVNGVFTFKTSLDFTGAEESADSYAYYITGAAGNKGSLQPVYDTGNIEVTLKNGESFTIEELPAGTRYTVEEAAESQKDYLVYVNGKLTEGDGKGTASDVIKTDDSEAESVSLKFANVEMVSVKGTKVWNIPEGTELPESIVVKLLQKTDGAEAGYGQHDQKVVTAEDNWSYEWDNLPGYSLEGDKYTYTVDEAELDAYSKDIEADAVSGEWKITNTMRTGTFDVTVYKTLAGQVLASNQFTFLLKDSDGNIVAQAANGEPDADGRASVSFTDVSLPAYDGNGEYTYTIHEKNDNQPGYQYDGEAVVASVQVSVDPKDDTRLVAEVWVNGEKDTFENVYKKGDAFFTPAFAKKMSGRDFSSGDEYTFTMVKTAPDGTVTKESKTISPDSGTYYEGTFGTSTFGIGDIGQIYTYEIYEEGGSASNITYDTRHYVIKVAIIDDGNDNLTAEATSDGEGFTAAVFTNTYTTPDSPGGSPGGGTSGGGGSSGGGHRAVSTITQEDVPLAYLPGAPSVPVLIDDGEIPLEALPKTGQSSVKTVLVMMMSGILLALTTMSKKRKEES